MFSRIDDYLLQPNGATIVIELQNDNYLADLQTIEGPDAKEQYSAKIQVVYPFGSFHSGREFTRKLYGNKEGLFLHKKAKTPFYCWGKEAEGKSRSLNEPIPIKKDLFY